MKELFKMAVVALVVLYIAYHVTPVKNIVFA